MKFGVQNSVVAWDDPWHLQSCKTMMRTGERRYFPSQDIAPSKSEFLRFVREELGADFIMQHVMPVDSEIETLIDDLAAAEIPFMLGNEFGNANRVRTPGTNRYDIPLRLVEKAQRTGWFMGLQYDETEHLQMNNLIYDPDAAGLYQWVNPQGKTLAEMEEGFVDSVSKFMEKYGCPVYAEVLFGTLYHALARGGMRLSFKLMQCEFASLQAATALGAVRQYRNPVGITIDTWGSDVGRWFTRLWGLPGHCPEEFANGLELGYHISPDFLFVENCDPLARSTEKGIELLEYGRIYRDFLARRRGSAPPYAAQDARCEIAVIRSEDGVFAKNGTFFNAGPYGALHLKNDSKTNSFFDVMHVLSHGTLPDSGSTQHHMPGLPYTRFERTDEAIRSFPKADGLECPEYVHTLFQPLNKVLVFDSFADERCLEECRLIVVCGSRLSPQTVRAIVNKAGRGAKVLAAEWFREELNACPDISFFESFADPAFAAAAKPFMGCDKEWKIAYEGYELTITNPSGDGISLDFGIEKK